LQDALVLYLPGLIILAAIAWAGTIMVDGDTYLHVAAGQWVIQHGHFLHQDPFTYTYQGAPWTDPEWLSEVAMAIAFRAAGWSGVGLIFAAAASLTAILLTRRLLKHLEPLAAIIVAQLALACVAQSLSSRPYLLALPLLVAWADGLIAARQENSAPRVWLLPLMTLWSNMHGSFLFGIALVGPFAAEAFFAERTNRLRVVRDWSLFAAGSVAAALINPNGFSGFIAPAVFSIRPILAHVVDWQSSVFPEIGPLEIAILSLLAVALYRPVRVPVFRLLLVLLLLHMTLAHRRHIYLFAVMTPLLLAEPIALALSRKTDATGVARSLSTSRVANACAAVVALAVILARLFVPDVRANDRASPLKALAQVPPAVARLPVLNEDVLGGFLIWHGIRPFIDTREELYDDAFLSNYVAIITPWPNAVVSTLARYHIGWTFLAPRNGANVVLDSLADWRVVYADKYVVIHVRLSALQERR
jgi:hypothetical protein